MKTSVGIIGTGGIANARAQSVQQLADIAELVAVTDIEPEKANAFAAKYGSPEVLPDHRAMLDRDDIDMVMICTPAFNHAELSVEALEAGKAVLCEKPIAGSLKQVDAMIAALDRHGGPASSTCQFRHGRGLKLFKSLMEDGLTGRVLQAQTDCLWRRTADYYAKAPWRGTWKGEMGGALMTQAIHTIDALFSVLDEPVAISAEVDTLVQDIETDDTSCAVVRMADRSMATINAGTNCQRQLGFIRIQCENVLAESNETPYQTTAWPWRFTSADPDTQSEIDRRTSGLTEQPDDCNSLAEVRSFITSLRAGETPAVSFRDVRRTFEIITGIYKSGFTGERVRLPIEPGDPFYSALHGNLPQQDADPL